MVFPTGELGFLFLAPTPRWYWHLHFLVLVGHLILEKQENPTHSSIYTGSLKAVLSDTKETARPLASLTTLRCGRSPCSLVWHHWNTRLYLMAKGGSFVHQSRPWKAALSWQDRDCPMGAINSLGVIQSHECSSTWKRWAVGKGWTFITCRATWHLVNKQPSVGKRELLHTVSFPKWKPDFISCNQGSHSDTRHKTTNSFKVRRG